MPSAQLTTAFLLLLLSLSSSVQPTFAQSSPKQSTGFAVDDDGNKPDWDPGNGVCRTCNRVDEDGNCVEFGGCTLRAAIEETNALAGADQITFAVATVVPVDPLPVITGPLTFDGALRGDARFVLDGSSFGFSNPALDFSASGNVLRNVEIRFWRGNGATFRTGNNAVENVHVHANGLNGPDGGLTFFDGGNNQILNSRIEKMDSTRRTGFPPVTGSCLSTSATARSRAARP